MQACADLPFISGVKSVEKDKNYILKKQEKKLHTIPIASLLIIHT
jgi:hypothetical protein